MSLSLLKPAGLDRRRKGNIRSEASYPQEGVILGQELAEDCHVVERHTLDAVVWALKLGAPTSIEATSCGLNPDTHPLSAIVTYRFPARENLPPLKLTWYEGTRPPRPEELEDGRHMPAEGGVVFKGSKGKLMCGVYGESPRLIPEKLMEETEFPAKTIPRIEGTHEQEWARSCKEGKKAGACFEYSGPLTEICLLGNIAKRLDARIAWDSAGLRVTNNADAEPLGIFVLQNRSHKYHGSCLHDVHH